MSFIDIDNSAPAAVPVPSRFSWIQRFAEALDRPRLANLALAVILLVAALFRFNGLDWDEGRHLHPDERFLSTVTNDLKWPENFEAYFDPQVSTLSPYSNPNMGLFVYGMLPVYIVKWTAIQLNNDNYDRITFVGRALSGLFDLGAIFVLFLIGRWLYGRRIGLLAAALLSFSVLNIQLSHFYTVDTFANLFILATLYFLLRAHKSGRWLDYALTGLMFGLGLASKLSVFTLVAPILVMAGLDLHRRAQDGDIHKALEHTLLRTLTIFLVALLAFRILQPIAFAGPGFWNWSLNPQWLDDILEQEKITRGETDLPWVQQWTGRSIAFPLYNILFWGMGLPLGLASFAGLSLAAFELVRQRRMEHLIPVTYIGVTFLYHAITFIKFMRYFLPIYPFLILMAAYGLARLWERSGAFTAHMDAAPESFRSSRTEAARRLLSSLSSRKLAFVLAALVVAGTFLYALAFNSIYNRPNTRIAASRWMQQNLPAGSTLANEHWDDWLPIGGVDGIRSYGESGLFLSVEMRNYEDDTPDKLDRMVDNLSQADYIILSSNRLVDSIPRLPMRYPMTIRYYDLLFRGELGFERVREFTSYPALLGIQIPDQAAEESFSVYDHPRVQIFQKTSAFDPQKVRRLLGEGIVWESVLHLTPLQASAAPHSLQLTAADQARYKQAATWSSSGVHPGSWGSRLPVLAWFVVVQVIGFLALPLTMIVFQSFADRGYLFAKAIGLLLVAWGSWLLASLRLLPFTWWSILIVMALLLAGSALLIIPRQKRADVLSFLRTRWKLLLLEEGLFWIFFGLLFVIRWNNPDLWHPGMGGEKPMDLAYLTAIVQTPYFPAYDPWFSGGYINYYYFGFVLVATLIHLTGIVPALAYNLAIPTFFALTAMGAFTVAFNFVERRQTETGTLPTIPGRRALLVGLAGALFVAVIGNLGQAKLLWDGVRDLSTLPDMDGASLQLKLAQFTEGLSKLLGGEELSIRTEWWYWNATRLIPPGQGEAGPINELPFFTFLFGDLHAHLMALPFTLLVLGLALNWIHTASAKASPAWRDPVEIGTLILLALTTGALWPMNTWDFPTYTVLAIAALVCREVARRGRVDLSGLWAVAWQTLMIVALGRLLFLPFHQNYASAYFGADLWDGSRSPLWAFLLIHGFFLFVLVSYLAAEFFGGQGHNAVVRSWRLSLRYWRRTAHLRGLIERLTNPSSGYRFTKDAVRLALVVIGVIFLFNKVMGLLLALVLLTALLLFRARPDPGRQFLLCMIGLGLLFTALVEVVVLKGDISRMNTVFKFYLQVWVLWAVASAAVLPALADRLNMAQGPELIHLPELREGRGRNPRALRAIQRRRRMARSGWSQRWWWAFGLLLAVCLLYPLTAAPVRMRDRFENSTAKTLDGTIFMRTSVYMDDGRPVPLRWDLEAIEWLGQNVQGIPTILEASTPLYRWGSRVSIYTGLPTVIGWDWHQKQQRSILPGRSIDRRIEDVRTMYNSNDPEQAGKLLDLYGVKYVYVGPLERLYYDPAGLDKFDQAGHLWSLVYQNEQVKIYEVR